MKTKSNKLTMTILIMAFSISVPLNYLYAQQDSLAVMPPPIKLNGPRLGITYIGPGEIQDDIQASGHTEIISQFGWQFENRLFSLQDGTTGLIEYVLLVGGLEQNIFMPSASMLIGLRSGKGFEFGAGPSVSLAGAGFAISVGYSFRNEYMFFPVNLAIVPSSSGVRFSLLFGFNARRK